MFGKGCIINPHGGGEIETILVGWPPSIDLFSQLFQQCHTYFVALSLTYHYSIPLTHVLLWRMTQTIFMPPSLKANIFHVTPLKIKCIPSIIINPSLTANMTHLKYVSEYNDGKVLLTFLTFFNFYMILIIPSQWVSLQGLFHNKDTEEEEDCIRAERDFMPIVSCLYYINILISDCFLLFYPGTGCYEAFTEATTDQSEYNWSATQSSTGRGWQV